jgi:hypothetical protein
MSKGRIICGFAGIGKSTMAKKRANVVDLESTPFQRDWQTYARVANHMKNNGYTVLVSCHNELRTQLHNDGIEYDVVLPNLEQKEVFMNRYANRGNTGAFIKLLDENWADFCKELPWEIALRINTEFLDDIIPAIDAVPVVRCGSCKWWDNNSDLPGCVHEFNGLVCSRPDDFCSYGEQKDGDA